MREHEFFETHTTFPFTQKDAGTSATYLRALIENSPIAIVVLDAQYRYTMCNPAFQKLFQYTPKELSSADLDDLDASLARTFRLKDRYNLDLRVDSTNLLNHVVFTNWNTTLNPASNPALNPDLNSPLFGLPAAANAMRSLQTTMRLRF